MAYLSFSSFTRRYLIVKDQARLNAGNQKLISEPLVSGTESDQPTSPPGRLAIWI
jgi:hypothetical protein